MIDPNPDYNPQTFFYKYELQASRLTIICRLCTFQSFNPNDVKNRYCPMCCIFHDDHPLNRGQHANT